MPAMTLPAYLRILQDLRVQISSCPIGAQLPTDEALMRDYRVSRFTARAAIDVLVADGIVKRYRGRGTFVVNRPQGAGTWMLASLDDIMLSSFPSAPTLIHAGEARCDARVSGALGLDDDATAWRIVTSRAAGGAPYTYSQIHLPLALARRLPEDWHHHLAERSVVEMVAAANMLAVRKAIQVAHAIAAEGDVAEHLAVPPGAPVLVLERSYIARDDSAIEHARIFCRPDRYKQIIEFHRAGERNATTNPIKRNSDA
jgi:GntR family transcriptional regulator